jgi:DUF4097 and DUF4098 domain-containing protein YvlB
MVLAGLLGALAAGGLFAGAQREEERRFSLAGTTDLVISYSEARLSIREAGGEELILTERLRNAEDAKVSAEGGALSITGDDRNWIPFNARRIEAEIAVPRSYRGNFQIRSGSGSIHSDARLVSGGSIEIRVSSGTMNLGRLEAPRISLRSSSGSVNAGELAGSTEITLSSGALRLGTLRGESHRVRSSSGSVQLDQVSGNLDLEAASGRLTIGVLEGESHRVRSSSGSVRAERISGSLDLEAASGALDIGALEGERHRLRSNSGSVTVKGLAGAAEFIVHSGGLWVEAARLSGDLSFDLRSGGLDLALPPGASFNLDAETSSGGIRVSSGEEEYSARNRSVVVRPFGENPEYTVLVRANSGRVNISR